MSYGQAAYTPAEQDICIEETSSSPKKVKKPGVFKRWLSKHVKDAIQQERENEAYSKRGLVTAVSRRDSLDSNPMVMKIYRANGGTIVETTTYDRHKDRSQNQLHIIGHDVDLGQGLSKIITMESLRG